MKTNALLTIYHPLFTPPPQILLNHLSLQSHPQTKFPGTSPASFDELGSFAREEAEEGVELGVVGGYAAMNELVEGKVREEKKR